MVPDSCVSPPTPSVCLRVVVCARQVLRLGRGPHAALPALTHPKLAAATSRGPGSLPPDSTRKKPPPTPQPRSPIDSPVVKLCSALGCGRGSPHLLLLAIPYYSLTHADHADWSAPPPSSAPQPRLRLLLLVGQTCLSSTAAAAAPLRPLLRLVRPPLVSAIAVYYEGVCRCPSASTIMTAADEQKKWLQREGGQRLTLAPRHVHVVWSRRPPSLSSRSRSLPPPCTPCCGGVARSRNDVVGAPHADDESNVGADVEGQEEQPQHADVVPEGRGVDADELEHHVARAIPEDRHLMGQPSTGRQERKRVSGSRARGVA